MSFLIRLFVKFFPLEVSIVAPVSAHAKPIEANVGILWAYAPKQKSLKGRAKRRELRYIIPLRTGITGCPTCGHPIIFPKLCGNCLRYVMSHEWEYRQKHYTMDRVESWKERWEAMREEWMTRALQAPMEAGEDPAREIEKSDK